MRCTTTDTEVAIIGGGLASSTAATMLRAGVRTMLIDPNPIYPLDLRREKLDTGQVSILRKTGLTDAVLPATTFDGGTRDGKAWIARFGRLIDKRRGQYRILSDDTVNTMRTAIPPSVVCVIAKAVSLTSGNDHKQVSLSNGSSISVRLMLAHGLSVALKDQVGIERIVTNPCHSITVAVDLKSPSRHRPGRRCVRKLLPDGRQRYRKGPQRRRAAVKYPYPEPRHGGGQDHQFYDDPVKRAYDNASASWACRLRSLSIEEGFTRNLQRTLRFIVGAACQRGMIANADQIANRRMDAAP
jgi:2-polyprenyl-6-methoxyphenol hydroxylase-like FAD-dependent oxidoreductase